MNQENNEKGIVSNQKGYKVEAKYSQEAMDKKLMRFTTPSGDSFEVSADEMISMLVGQVNAETLAPAFVESTKVNVVQVLRTIEAVLTEDLPKGTKIPINYMHPYPLEFAIIEEAYKLAKIIPEKGVMELTKEFIDEVKAKITPEADGFVKQFYKSYPKVELGKSEAE